MTRRFIPHRGNHADNHQSLAQRIPDWVKLRAICRGQVPAIGLGDVVELAFMHRNHQYAAPPLFFRRDLYDSDPDSCWEKVVDQHEDGFASN